MSRTVRLALMLAATAIAAGLLLHFNPPRTVYPRPDATEEKARRGARLMEARRLIGTPAPELLFRRLEDDSEGRLSDLQGRVVVLNVWSTGCGPCRAEMPALVALQRKHGDEGLRVLALTFESKLSARAGLERKPFELPRSSGYAKRPDWIPQTPVPLTIVMDRAGIVRCVHIGRQSEEELRRDFAPYL